ncbi:helix-turn-helix transcriptional regulator [Streptomyces sp. TR06-5]|uniref:PadR family transcriptional regulator n=1 Tax=unclassified Streptomyces TaxID=2593676 RepID=UPI00399F550F
MPSVFAHGRLRLYLLRLLDEAPRHGYEVIRLLEERFQGLYAPSAGTVYPRLAKLEAEGLVSHSTEGGRKVYALTDAGRAELAARQDELTELELEIRESLASLAAEMREDVSGSADDLRREVRRQARQARGAGAGSTSGASGRGGRHGDPEAWREVREEIRRAKEDWKQQARRAREDARRAQQQVHEERKAHAEAMDEVGRIARRVQGQVQEQARSGDWQGAVLGGLSELGRHMGDLGRIAGEATGWPPRTPPHSAPSGGPRPPAGKSTPEEAGSAAEADAAEQTGAPAGARLPEWAQDRPSTDPARDLDRLLDRFRDDVRDAARDHGVGPEQLRAARRVLGRSANELTALWDDPPQE